MGSGTKSISYFLSINHVNGLLFIMPVRVVGDDYAFIYALGMKIKVTF